MTQQHAQAFEEAYPALSRWVQHFGWLELGKVYWTGSLIRVLDEGGLIWEGGAPAGDLSEALTEAEAALSAWFREQHRDQ